VLRTVTFTLLALVAFASNSLLTRSALGTGAIDAATFTAIRLLAGAAMLVAMVRVRDGGWTALRGGGALGPAILFAYAVPFSLAYVRIGAAVGALVLFGVVQLTMVGYGLATGERPSLRTWAGLALATGGLVLLTAPAATRIEHPDGVGVALMAIAGAAWAVYTLAGRSSVEPVAGNARNFLWSSPLAVLVVLATPGHITATTRGVLLALVSGGVTSGLGYVLWYRALPRLSVTQAAIAQVGVPIIAAAGGVALLGEPLTVRLVLAGAAVLGGIGLLVSRRLRR
jgi:drug/metabolite transporter (DMT)-like permease